MKKFLLIIFYFQIPTRGAAVKYRSKLKNKTLVCVIFGHLIKEPFFIGTITNYFAEKVKQISLLLSKNLLTLSINIRYNQKPIILNAEILKKYFYYDGIFLFLHKKILVRLQHQKLHLCIYLIICMVIK
jgi:hypothetical protein